MYIVKFIGHDGRGVRWTTFASPTVFDEYVRPSVMCTEDIPRTGDISICAGPVLSCLQLRFMKNNVLAPAKRWRGTIQGDTMGHK